MFTKVIILLLVCQALGQDKMKSTSVEYSSTQNTQAMMLGNELKVESENMAMLVDYDQDFTVIASEGNCIVIDKPLPDTPTICEAREAMKKKTVSLKPPDDMIEAKLVQSNAKISLGPLATKLCTEKTISATMITDEKEAEAAKVSSKRIWWWPWYFHFTPCHHHHCYHSYNYYNYYPYYYRPCFYWRYHICYWRHCYFFYPYY